MQYKKFDNTIVVRLDPNDEIISQLLLIAETENIKLAMVNALGTTADCTMGAYNVAEQKFYQKEYKGAFEIVSLHGSITKNDEKPYVHVHMSIGDKEGNLYGGHLSRAIISATCEIFITVIDGEIGRVKSMETGLNIFDL